MTHFCPLESFVSEVNVSRLVSAASAGGLDMRNLCAGKAALRSAPNYRQNTSFIDKKPIQTETLAPGELGCVTSCSSAAGKRTCSCSQNHIRVRPNI